MTNPNYAQIKRLGLRPRLWQQRERGVLVWFLMMEFPRLDSTMVWTGDYDDVINNALAQAQIWDAYCNTSPACYH